MALKDSSKPVRTSVRILDTVQGPRGMKEIDVPVIVVLTGYDLKPDGSAWGLK